MNIYSTLGTCPVWNMASCFFAQVRGREAMSTLAKFVLTDFQLG